MTDTTRPDWMTTATVSLWLQSDGFHIADRGALDAALHRPYSTPFGREVYPTVWLKAAALLHSIETTHPMIDGNKRTGVILTHVLLRTFGITSTPSSRQWFDLVIAVADGHYRQVPEIARELEAMYTDDAP